MNRNNCAKRLGKFLIKKRMTLAVAESCTGGALGTAITAVPGASRYFAGGIIAYDNRIKSGVLHVPEAVLDRYGAVSRQTVEAMANGVMRLFSTDCSIAVSGIAGPDGGTKKKPVGLVYVAAAVNTEVRTLRLTCAGKREQIRRRAVEESLKLLLRFFE